MFLKFGPTFIWVAVNLLVLYFFLRKVLFKPVTEFMDKRTNSIREALENSEKSRSEALKLKQDYEEQIRKAREEADKILNDAKARAGKEYDSMLAAARKDAAAVMEKARAEIETEREQMLKGIRNQVAGLALSAASRIIEANMDTEKNRALVDKFIDEAGAA